MTYYLHNLITHYDSQLASESRVKNDGTKRFNLCRSLCSLAEQFCFYCHFLSLLRSLFLGCHATLPPKSPNKRLPTSEPHSFPFVFVVCLRSVEQTNHIIAKCDNVSFRARRSAVRTREGFLAFVSRRTSPRVGGVRWLRSNGLKKM